LFGAALGAALLACCVYAWRRGEAIAACGWASVALVATLSWALPWYVVWVLPLAALSASRRLRIASLALGVYLIIAWAPASGRRGFGGVGARSSRSPRRASASWRLRACERSSCATAATRAPALARSSERCDSLSEREASTSKLASTREAVTLACWPPGPEERLVRILTSASGSVSCALMRRCAGRTLSASLTRAVAPPRARDGFPVQLA